MESGTPHASGQIFQARFEFVSQHHGPEAMARVLAELPPEDQQQLQTVRRDQWYPFAALMRLDRAIARVLMPGDPLVFEKLGEASARHRTEWLGEHASLVNVHAFLSRVADEHHRFHDFGKAIYHRTGFTEGELSFSEYPLSDVNWCAASRGYFRGAVGLLTGRTPVVEEPRCQTRGDRECLFAIRWQARPDPEGPRVQEVT